jgi:FRG domain
MAIPITTYSDLKRALKALPSPPHGTVRVYRGQTEDYPKIEPSGLRRSIRNQAIWHVYSSQLYQSLMSEVMPPNGEVTMEMLNAAQIWFHAIAQHYGPGSDFLDVTLSSDVALWFALHQYEEALAHGVIGPPGPPNPETDHPTAMELIRYQPTGKPGYLYAFDLPRWDPTEPLAAGTVVDLADAPPIFSSSPRIQVQAGCLVYCRENGAGRLDLKPRKVEGTPLEVGWPMRGAPGLDRRVADLFPSPEKDAWYARLLSVPMTYDPSSPPPRLRRPIPVAVYFDPEDPRYTEEVRFRNVSIPPPLLHRSFSAFARGMAPAAGELSPEATAIILEAPFIYPYPPGDSDMWHHGLLASDLPERSPVYDFATNVPCGEVPLTNVLVEFSVLEQVGWDHFVKTDAPVTLLRGVWLRRQGPQFAVAFIHQKVPGPGPETSDFMPFNLDPPSGKFVFGAPGETQTTVPITEQASLAKPVLAALMLLRHLSPALKAEPFPLAQFGISEGGKPSSRMLVACACDAARLYRAAGTSRHRDWYVVRDAATPVEPFTNVRMPAKILEFNLPAPARHYGEVPMETITRLLHAS